MMSAIRRLFATASLSVLLIATQAQPTGDSKANKPYKVLTSGKQVTIKSNKNILHVMLWTSGGDRVVEGKNINASSYLIHVPVSHKTFFLMVTMSDGKIYTEKIGVQ